MNFIGEIIEDDFDEEGETIEVIRDECEEEETLGSGHSKKYNYSCQMQVSYC